jgi:hypothetical protein
VSNTDKRDLQVIVAFLEDRVFDVIHTFTGPRWKFRSATETFVSVLGEIFHERVKTNGAAFHGYILCKSGSNGVHTGRSILGGSY